MLARSSAWHITACTWKLLWPLWLEVHKYFKIRVSAIALSSPPVSPPVWPLCNAVAVLGVYSTVNHYISSLFCNWRFYPTAHRKLVCPFVYGSATVVLPCDVTSLLELTIAVALTLHVTVTLSQLPWVVHGFWLHWDQPWLASMSQMAFHDWTLHDSDQLWFWTCVIVNWCVGGLSPFRVPLSSSLGSAQTSEPECFLISGEQWDWPDLSPLYHTLYSKHTV